MSTPHLRLGVITSMAALFALSGCTSLPPACPSAADIKPEQMHGVWTVQLDSAGHHWSLQLGPHPEHQGSLRGELTQGALRYPVVADLDGRDFTLEESHDGRRIAATWLGEVQVQHCDWSIAGERKMGDANRPPQPFVIRSNRLR